jgi:AmmeMemoRadiSam system protein A
MPYLHELTDEEKRELLRIARATLKEFFSSGRIPPGAPHRTSMTDPAGAFVVVRVGGELRGSMGQIDEARPLYKTIQELVVAAATKDPRHAPVVREDLPKVTFELTVLGPRTPLGGPGELEIGTHGVCITVEEKRAVHLPAVAAEAGWSPEQLLEKTCEKAGLAADAWKGAGALVERFTVQAFREDAPPTQSFSFAPPRR